MNLKICYLKIDVSCDASANFHHMSQNATEFARCHHFAQPWQWDSQKHAMRHVWHAALATQNDDGVLQSAARDTENANHLPQKTQSIASAAQNDFRHFMKHVGMSQSATPATRSETTRHLKPTKSYKSTRFCRTRHGHGHFVPTTVARKRLRTVASTKAASSEHVSTPRPPK